MPILGSYDFEVGLRPLHELREGILAISIIICHRHVLIYVIVSRSHLR